MLPKEAIEEFKKLYKERFKVELSDEEAAFRATNLVNLYEIVRGISLGKESEGENLPCQR
jgi:hypothetical protein